MQSRAENALINRLLLSGILASIIVGIGEYLLHYIPEGPTGEVSMLFKVPLERARWGHFIAILGVPLYFSGYYGLKLFFANTNKTLSTLLFIMGVLSFFVGGVWVSSRYFAAQVFQQSMGTSNFNHYLAVYEDNLQILVWVLRISISLVSFIYVLLIIKNKLGIPKWVVFTNPIFVLVLVISTLFFIKPIGIHIAPIAMNVTHLIFFGSLFLVKTKHSIS